MIVFVIVNSSHIHRDTHFRNHFYKFFAGKIQIVIIAKSGKISYDPKIRLMKTLFLCTELHLIFYKCLKLNNNTLNSIENITGFVEKYCRNLYINLSLPWQYHMLTDKHGGLETTKCDNTSTLSIPIIYNGYFGNRLITSHLLVVVTPYVTLGR